MWLYLPKCFERGIVFSLQWTFIPSHFYFSPLNLSGWRPGKYIFFLDLDLLVSRNVHVFMCSAKKMTSYETWKVQGKQKPFFPQLQWLIHWFWWTWVLQGLLLSLISHLPRKCRGFMEFATVFWSLGDSRNFCFFNSVAKNLKTRDEPCISFTHLIPHIKYHPLVASFFSLCPLHLQDFSLISVNRWPIYISV